MRKRSWAAFRASILSGIPTIIISLFRRCPVCGPRHFQAAHGLRPGQMPLAREQIPDAFFISRVQHLRLARM